jgi:hypothetical protein
MLLSAEMYQQIVKTLKSDTRSVQDRRKSPRVGLRAKINIIPLNSRRLPMEAQCVWVRDVSAGGFGLVVRQKLQLGQLFIVRMERRGEEPLSLLCDVVRSHGQDHIGTRILRPLAHVQSASDLQAAGAAPTAAATASVAEPATV